MIFFNKNIFFLKDICKIKKKVLIRQVSKISFNQILFGQSGNIRILNHHLRTSFTKKANRFVLKIVRGWNKAFLHRDSNPKLFAG